MLPAAHAAPSLTEARVPPALPWQNPVAAGSLGCTQPLEVSLLWLRRPSERTVLWLTYRDLS